MNCEEAQRLISTGWEESEEKAAELTEHLKNCPECKRYAGQMRRLGELLAALPQSEPPRTLAEDAKSLAQKRSAGRKKTVRILTGLAAALVICVAAATWAMLPRAPEQVAMDLSLIHI